LHNNGYEKVAISQLESVKKEPVLLPFIEKGTLPLEIEEYKKGVFIYALVRRVHLPEEEDYTNQIVIQSYEPSYIQSVNSAVNKVDLFAEFKYVFLLHDPTVKPKVESKAKAK